MPAQRGQCPNFGTCNLADSAEIILIQPGAEFRCPECNSKLRLVQNEGLTTRLTVVCGALLLIFAGTAGWIFIHRAHTHIPPTPISPAARAADKSPAEIVGTLTDEPITFRQGQTQISEEDKSAIKDSLSRLEQYPKSRLLVEAHVAPSNSPEADQKLSDDRALEVKHFLSTDCGIPESRIFTKGYGSDQPPERSADESDQEWNRRARSVRILFLAE